MDTTLMKQKIVELQAILGMKLIELRREASGALINSLDNTIVDNGNYYFDINVVALSYWKNVEWGTPGANIPFDARTRSGAQANAYIQGLMNWVKIKGLASDNATIKAIAFAIATKQTAKGGWGKGNPMDKTKLGFVKKTEAKRDAKVQEIATVFQAEIISLVSTMPNSINIII